MSEDDAHALENKLIESYKKSGQCIANLQLGGQGFQFMHGDKNPMYGRPWYTEDTPVEKIEAWKSKVGSPGESNPMFGVSPRERMDEDTYRGWIEAHRKIVGDKNPNYGNRKLSAFYKKNPGVAKQKQSRPGSRNGRARNVAIISKNGEVLKVFDYIGLCAEHLVNLGLSNTKPPTVAANITKSANSGKEYCGYHYMFADE